MSATIYDLADYRDLRPARQVFDRARLTFDLLHGPITDEIVAALETLPEPELEAFFRARARAKIKAALERAKST